MGSADDEISRDRGSLPWSCSASTLTILPSLTVTRTCASPYCVATTSPVAVPETAPEPGDFEIVAVLADFDDVEVVALADAVDLVDAVAVGTAGVRGWKARMPAVPAIVAVRTMGDRRIGSLRLRT